MVKITEKLALKDTRSFLICDFSPPRSADIRLLEDSKNLEVDYICVAYNPGKSVRLDSAVAAHFIKQNYKKDVIFNLASRDMNKLAIQTHLLGASMLGLENVVILKGDEFTQDQRSKTGAVTGFNPTSLIHSIKLMNEGLDYKGRELATPTDFCIGAVADLGKGIHGQANLAMNKVTAGADFILTQPVYDVGMCIEFREILNSRTNTAHVPVIFGVQIPLKDSVMFGDVPIDVLMDLDCGRPGWEIALDMIQSLKKEDIDSIYLIPPILRGGARDYQSAQEVVSALT